MKINEARHLYRASFKVASSLTELIEFIHESNICDEEAKPLKMKLARLIADIELDFGKGIKDKFPQIQEELDMELNEHGKLES